MDFPKRLSPLSFIPVALFTLLCSGNVTAQEPANIGQAKIAAIIYYDSGEYQSDISKVVIRAKKYLQQHIAEKRHANKQAAIILDIDETSLSNYPHMLRLTFGGSTKDLTVAEMDGTDPAIQPTLDLYHYAREQGIAVFFVTGRYEFERAMTIKNLKAAGFTKWDGIYFKPQAFKGLPVSPYKQGVRKSITQQGYDIVLNVGDQNSDLTGGYAEKNFKLPNPFYYIP